MTKLVPIPGNTYPVHKKLKALSPLAYWHKADGVWMVPEEHAEAAHALVAAVPERPKRAPVRELSARQKRIEELGYEIAVRMEEITKIEGEWLAEVAKLKRKRASTLEIGQFGCESHENTEMRCVFVANRDREDCLFCGLPSERK